MTLRQYFLSSALLASSIFLPACAATTATQAAADKLYADAVAAYNADDFGRALTLGKEACAQAPKNARLRGGLALFEKRQPLIYSLSTAKEAVKLAPNDPLLLTNLGIMLQKNGQRADAVERYKKADGLDGKDYRPKLGVAQCLGVDGTDGLLIADRELKAAVATSQDSVEKWVNIGNTYLILRMNAAATSCFVRALKLDPPNYALKLLRLKTALLEHDLPTIHNLAEAALTDKLTDRDVALGLALLPDNDFAPDLKAKLIPICQRSFFGQAEFFYQLGRNFEAGAHLDMAFEAYQLALHYSPGECQYIISEIGNRLAAGRDDEAVAIWGQSSAERKKGLATSTSSGAILPPDRSVFAHAFNSIGELLQTANPGIHILQAKFKNVKCGCRLPVIRLKLLNQPGVVFANLEDAKDYPTTVVYDAKKNNAETIFKHARQQEDIVEVISDSPVQSIPELVRLIQSASDKADKHIFSLWSFVPPPMELPK